MESQITPRIAPATRLHTDAIDVAAAQGATTDEPIRQRYRDRDFGIGYGTSSGYASARRYSSGTVVAPLRVR